MCIITLTVSFIFFGYLLPFFFLFHSLYLVCVASWTKHSFASVLEHVDVVQDDADVPHPPGHFDLLREYSAFDFQDEDAQGNDDDTRTDYDTSLFDDNSVIILSTDIEITTCNIPPVIANDNSNEDPDEDYLSILSATRLVSAKSVTDLDETFSLDDDELLSESSTDTDAHMDTMDSCYNQLEETTGERPSTLHSNDSDDELTPEEEEILETVLCIRPPYTLPGFARLHPEDPHALDHVPRFSRHNIDPTVVFPVRRKLITRPEPTSRAADNAQVISTTISNKAHTVLKEMSLVWHKAKDEVKSNKRSSAIGTLFSSKLFNKQEMDSDILLPPRRDPFDSWPWIRDGVEQDLWE